MAKYKFIVVRAAIIDEYYEVEADSREEALGVAYDGNLPDPVKTQFVNWSDDSYQIIVEELIEPLYRMVKDYEPV